MIDPDGVLAFARAQEYQPGQNPRDVPFGTLWALTLPHPGAVRSVAWIGSPSPSDRLTLAQLMPDATIATFTRIDAVGTHGHDLVVVTDRQATRRLALQDPSLERLRAALTPSGTLVIEGRGRLMAVLAARMASAGRTDLLRVLPLRGPARALVRASDRDGIRLLASRGLLRPSVTEGVMRSWLRRRGSGALVGPSASAAAASGAPPARMRHARSALGMPLRALARLEIAAAQRTVTGRFILVHGRDAGRVPLYLRSAAASAGSPLDEEFAWALIRPGDYASQKLLWFLRRPGSSEATILVKMTRDSRFSHRLRNAYRSLAQLNATPGVPRDALPRALFSGEEAGLAIAAESLLLGRAMGAPRRHIDPLAARGVIDWLTAMAMATRTWSTGSEVAAALEHLLERLINVRVLSDDEIGFLRGELEVVAAVAAPIPVVFQHGDPGVLNVLVRPDGSIAVLDWENGERRGMPLWDLLYFVRSLGVATGQSSTVDRLEASLGPFLRHGPLADLLVGAMTDAARRLTLPSAMVRPLVFHCWVQQALKETTRLPAGDAARSIFVRFLRRLIAARDEPLMQRLSMAGEPQ